MSLLAAIKYNYFLVKVKHKIGQISIKIINREKQFHLFGSFDQCRFYFSAMRYQSKGIPLKVQ